MKEQTMPHPGHENHLCYLQETGVIDEFPEAYKDLVRDAKYFCRVCGRSAEKKESLCNPERL
jgi:hypothetical protein